MSIAERESEERYPAQYYPGYEPSEGYSGRLAYLTGLTTDDLREAYEAGRTAPVTEMEIDAAGYELFKAHMYSRTHAVYMNGDAPYKQAWHEQGAKQHDWKALAGRVFEVARKAASDE